MESIIENIKNILDLELLTGLLTIILLMFLSAFFAAIESSFFSLDYLKIKRLKSRGNKTAALVEKIRSNPKSLVITFLIGNELVNITASAVMSKIIIDKFGAEYLFIGVLIMTVFILTFGEITPKTIGSYYPEKYAFFAVRPFYLFYIIATPFRFVFMKFSEYILQKLGLELPVESHKLSVEDILSIITVGVEKKVFTEEEKEFIEATLHLHKTYASEIMTPRRDIFALPSGLTVLEALEKLKDVEYSRIPVYKENLDNILGILYVKDIILLKLEGKNEVIDKFVKKCIVIPEFTNLLELLKRFEKERIHLAIVVDEYGTVVGLITLQDILEYIVGELPEENDNGDNYIKQIDNSTWEVSGKLDIEILQEKIGIKLPEDYDFDTVAGFILYLLQRLPEENEEITYENIKLKIKKLDKNRVVAVIIQKLDKEKKEVNNA